MCLHNYALYLYLQVLWGFFSSLLLLFSLSYVTNQALLPKQLPLERRNAWSYARITVLVWQNQVSDICHMQHMPFPGRWLSQGFCSARMDVAVWGFLSILPCSWCDHFKFSSLVVGRKLPGFAFKQICAETSMCVQLPLCHLSIPGWLKLSLTGLQSWSCPFAGLWSPRCLDKITECSWQMQQLVQQFLGSKSETGQVEALGSPLHIVRWGTTSTSELW